VRSVLAACVCAHVHACSVTGILKGYDQLLNLVLDEVEEELQGDFSLPLLLGITDSQPRTRTSHACTGSCRPPWAHYHPPQSSRWFRRDRQSLRASGVKENAAHPSVNEAWRSPARRQNRSKLYVLVYASNVRYEYMRDIANMDGCGNND
jgi:hypothetical protein